MADKKIDLKGKQEDSLLGANHTKLPSGLINAKSLAELKQQAKSCALCKLYKTCKEPIFGIGSENAKIMFVGEAPGATEEIQGRPFVGSAGRLLNRMMQAIGLNRDEVYITNVLKCRPPNNRTPLLHEIKLCAPYLQQEITLVHPQIIVALGRIAAQFLLNTTEPMNSLRGRIHYYGPQKITLLVTYHPAYLLRVPADKSKAYIDFAMIKKLLSDQV